ncbi:hypothetical protein D3C81_2165300 [compost metagenome]
MPNHSMPIGLAEAECRPLQAWEKPSGMRATSPFQPPMSINPSTTNGKKPKTIKKNCKTSL